MSRMIWPLLMSAAFLAVIISGCAGQDEQATATVTSPTRAPTATPTVGPPTATPFTEPVIRLARVDSLEILTDDAEPAQVGVRLRGALSNGCAQIDDIVVDLEGGVFTIAVLEVQDPPGPDQECTEAEEPFDETIELTDLEPGSYTVSAHGLEGTFTIEAEEDTTAEATPVAELTTAAASGRVWHDLCIGTGATDGEAAEGCVTISEDVLRADGLLGDEPGIEGVKVALATGSCDAPAEQSTLTDADGQYTFDDLPIGAYCISVDAADEQNQEILLTGVWTSPESDTNVAEQAITIDSDGREGLDFGWDYDFLPVAEFDPETCENSFAYLEDLNIPDDTEFAANQPFSKGWLLRNNGTCPWSTEYSIVFVGGDQMSAPDSIPLEQPVVPGQTLEVGIDMIAPAEPGTYRGNWQMADPSGEPFGIDGIIEDAFWLRIVVAEQPVPAATASPNSGTIGGVVWDDFCLNSDPGRGCVEFPEGSGIYIADGELGPGEAVLADITISLASGACPTDGSLPSGADIASTTTTDEDGLYRFQNLDTGMYCIFMDALSEENVDFLIPGNWTYPTTGVGRYRYFLDPGEQALDLDFGWDYAD